MTKKLVFLVGGTLLLFGLVYVFRLENIGTTALWNMSDGGKWLLPLIGVAALIDSVNPCAFSILLLTVAFLLSIGKLRSNVLQIGIAYIVGLFFVYLLIGLGLLQTLHLFDTPHFMASVGAALLVLLGPSIPLYLVLLPLFPFALRALRRGWDPSPTLVLGATLVVSIVLDLAFWLGRVRAA